MAFVRSTGVLIASTFMHAGLVRPVLAVLVVLLLCGLLWSGCSSPPGATVDRPSAGFGRLAQQVLDESAVARLVCLGEIHGSTADVRLRSDLIRRPGFSDRFGLVLFEGASAARQSLIDRFVLDGESLPREELAPAWRDAGRGLQWRLSGYEQLFRDLRELNESLPAERRVRLLGGAPPIPWGALRSPEDLAPWLDREAWLHERMRALLQEDRATLAVYGRHHCERLRFASTDLDRSVFSVLSVGPAKDVEFRRRFDLLGTQPELLNIDARRGRVLVRDTWGEGHLHRGSRFGELADLVVSYGELGHSGLEHRILVVNEEDLRQDEREELRRRDEWMAIAWAERSSETGS